MNKLTEMLDRDYIPKMAIIVYRDNAQYGNTYYLESRRITTDGRMGAGRPLKEETLAKIVKTMSVTDKSLNVQIHGVIPDNLLYCNYGIDKKVLVWYRTPEERMMFFTNSANMTDGLMKVPGLVYCMRNNSLSVFAFKGNKPKSILYRAPFYNVSESGVCLGSAKLEPPYELTYDNVIEYWETMFWKSEFAHILGTNPVNGNLSTITKDCIKNKKSFPTNILLKSKTTLKSLFV